MAHQAAPTGAGRLVQRVRAAVVIVTVAVAGGLLAEAGRQVEAKEAQAAFARTANPATPPA